MDWKGYYAAELRTSDAKSKILSWLRRAREEDRHPVGSLENAVLSFPHTALDAAGPLQAAVVDAVYRSHRRRLIALGVLHSSRLPDAAVAGDPVHPASERERAFDRLAGGFFGAAEAIMTPFGPLARAPLTAPPTTPVRKDNDGILHEEFSLDTFLSILRLGSAVWGMPPPRVMPIYVGLTRHPISGTFTIAGALGDWLREQWNDDTAIVATGDVVHYGSVYGSCVISETLPDLEARFLGLLQETLRLAFEQGDEDAAYRISRHELKSDQREMLPVLAALLDGGARADILAYRLTDYADILHVSPPCRVASALVAYTRGMAHETFAGRAGNGL